MYSCLFIVRKFLEGVLGETFLKKSFPLTHPLVSLNIPLEYERCKEWT